MQLPMVLGSPRRETDLHDIVPYVDTHSSDGTPRGTPRLEGYSQGVMTGPVAHLTPIPVQHPVGGGRRSGIVTPQSPHPHVTPIDTISVSSCSVASSTGNGRMSPLAT